MSTCETVQGRGCTLLVPAPPICDDTAVSDTGADTGDAYVRGGGGCTAVTTGPSWLALVLVALAALRRSRGAALLLLVVATSARAQGVDAQLVRTLDGGPFLLLPDADLGNAWEPRGAFALNYARDLVLLVDETGARTVLAQVTTEELGVSVRLGDAVRVGLSFPSHTGVIFDDTQVKATPGDLAVWATIPLRDAPKRLRLDWTVRIDAPTGTSTLYLGDPEGGVHGDLTAGFHLGGWRSVANLGVRLALPTQLPGITWGSRLEGGIGLSHRLVGPTWTTLEIQGSAGLPPARTVADVPIEALLSVGGVAWRGIGVSVGAGAGVTPGLGSPSLRIIAQVDARARDVDDADADGIVDRLDRCPSVPEDADGLDDLDGCPETDADGDGIDDEVDECPRDAETANGWQDADGCPDLVTVVTVSAESDDPAFPLERARLLIDGEEPLDVLGGDGVELVRAPGDLVVRVTADGFLPAEVHLNLPPGEVLPEVVHLSPVRFGHAKVRFEDANRRPVAGWLRGPAGPALVPVDGLDLRLAAGEAHLRVSAVGYLGNDVTVDVPRDATIDVVVTLAPSDLRVDGASITTSREVRFALDSAELDPAPDATGPLDEIAALMLRDDAVRLLRVEGHADEAGTSAYNLDLSRRRAEAVRAWLVGAGVAPERLEAIGSGESGATGGPRAVRAVTFTVLVWAD